MGTTGVYRPHTGDIRILYEADEETATVYIINIGIITSPVTPASEALIAADLVGRAGPQEAVSAAPNRT